jgi:NADPH:quinone reductase-like Zn-dependent oxidoreductase
MTAGSTAKRAFLRAAGADLVLDSRDPAFADALRRHWPDGVDVVLNSLAGEAMERSLALIRPFGRFVELGKRDFVENRRAPLRPLSLSALASLPEDAAVRNNWTGWFGIPAQWLPHWEPVPDNPEFIGGRLTDWSIAGGDSHK